MKKYGLGFVSAALLCGWMFLIFRFSAQTATESATFSGGFSNRLFTCVLPFFRSMTAAQQADFVEGCSFAVRKTGHFCIYMVLGWLAQSTLWGFWRRKWQHGAMALIFGMAYAASDEWHQLYVPGRSGELRDVVIDSAGVLCGIFLFRLICRWIKYGKKRRKRG